MCQGFCKHNCTEYPRRQPQITAGIRKPHQPPTTTVIARAAGPWQSLDTGLVIVPSTRRLPRPGGLAMTERVHFTDSP